MRRKEIMGAGILLWAVLLLTAAPSPVFAQLERVDVESYTIEAELFPSTHLITARVKIDFLPLTDLLTLALELNRSLRVQRVLDAQGEPLRFRQDTGYELNVDFLNPVPEGKASSLTIEYGGALTTAEGSPIENLKLAYIGPEGSYLLYPARWFPVSGYGVDRFTAEMRITVPTGEVVIASGEASQPVSESGKVTYTFRETHVTFPGTVVAGNYHVIPSTEPGPSTTFYLKRDDPELVQVYAEAVSEILEFYSRQFGSYPFERLAIVEIEDGTVGGYSGPGMALFAARGLTTSINYNLLGHELAHQWWRNLVSPETIHDRYLDEGLATYSAAMLEEEVKGQAAFEQTMRRVSIGALTREDVVPLSQSGLLREYSAEYQSIVFQKGAMVFHMLRYVVGQEKFIQALRTMATDYAWDTVASDDLQILMEEVSDQDLTYFFAQWVSSTGVPQFRRSWVVYRIKQGFQTIGKIEQDLDIFRMPVEVRILAEGARPISIRVDMVGTTADFTMNTRTKPLKVIIDPASRILKYDDRTRYEVQLARADQLMQEQAYLEAIKAYQEVLQLNRNSSLANYRIGDIFFRLQNYQEANRSFRAALQGDLNPRWIEVWCHLTLGKIFDLTGQRDRAVNEYRRALQTNDNAQGALDEANKYLKEAFRQASRRIS